MLVTQSPPLFPDARTSAHRRFPPRGLAGGALRAFQNNKVCRRRHSANRRLAVVHEARGLGATISPKWAPSTTIAKPLAAPPHGCLRRRLRVPSRRTSRACKGGQSLTCGSASSHGYNGWSEARFHPKTQRQHATSCGGRPAPPAPVRGAIPTSTESGRAGKAPLREPPRIGRARSELHHQPVTTDAGKP